MLIAPILSLLFSLAPAQATISVPDGYELQLLEPLGGKIARPKDWFYRERHGGPSYIWILSKEDPDQGPYRTGIRIQTLQGIKTGTGKTPEEFLRDFLTQKKSTSKVFSECGPETVGMFTRMCLETEELIEDNGPPTIYHIQYSVFWLDSGDLATVVTAGAPQPLWLEYKTTFDIMGAFELIDMSRFDSKAEPVPEGSLRPQDDAAPVEPLQQKHKLW
jgi:hypothetical protein